MSAIVSGAAAAALTAGPAAGLALENGQIRPYAAVKHHDPPGPALVEQLEASAAGSTPTAHRAHESAPNEVSGLDAVTVSDICRVEESSATLDAALCALSGNIETLLEPLLAGLGAVD